jgi:hypothetical protein
MTKRIKTANRAMHEYVNNNEVFTGSNVFAKEVGALYIVFSYGEHFPMYIYDYDHQQWYGNTDRYSQSTTRQQQQARPTPADGKSIHWHNTEILQRIVRAGGVSDVVAKRMEL